MSTSSRLEVPQSVQRQHDAIHSLLTDATREQGRVGVAARALASVLHQHFVREEQIALPPLGALATLASGALPADAVVLAALADTLRLELPTMLEEHKRIGVAIDDLRAAARADGAPTYERLADELAVHVLLEEEVLYPAAVLAGEVIRQRAERMVMAPGCGGSSA